MRDRAVWLLRALWFVLPLTVGPSIGAAVEDLDDGNRIGVLILAWVIWGLGLLATAVLLPVSLTVIRSLAPTPLVAAIWSMLDAEVDAIGIVGLVISVAIVAVAFSALVGDRMVDGASYGDERRMLLRPPTRLLAGPIPLSGALAAAGLTLGPLALATGSTVLGLIATIVGVPLALLAMRALHQLSRRWIVFVPNGFVLHDLNVLTEPVLFRRTAVERIGAAIAGTPARDLTLGAAGLLIECELTDPAPLGLRSASERGAAAKAELTDTRRFLFAPSRPGELLDEAERRRIAVDG
ncbi:MAG: hypothetical protein AAF567_24030 [Actinomycetota bacterium]